MSESNRMEVKDYVKRLQELMGPDIWQEHKPTAQEEPPIPTEPVHFSSDEDGHGQPSESKTTSPAKEDVLRSSTAWPETGLARGDPSKGTVFCPWKMVKNYPHAFIGKTNAQRAKHFFDNPTVHNHFAWDFYYLYNPGDMKNRHILFVPTYQFERLLEVINDKLDILLTIPGQKNAEKFNITFGVGGSPVPRFLGRSTSFEEFEALKRCLPPYDPDDDISRLSTMAQEDFLELLKQIQSFSSSKGTMSKKSEKKRIQRIQDHKSWGKSVKRVQRYLGIRKQASEISAFEKLSIADTEALPDSTPDPEVVAKPERGVVFVAIDIEAFEFSHDLITEIGVGLFDTRDISDRAPGDKGKDWFSLIRGYHFRIKENSWATNRVHVDGNADKFEFGKTEFVEQGDIKKLIARIVENPASLISKEDKAQSSTRPVVLVFHDSASDIKFLEALAYDVTEAENVLEIVDTRDMYQHGVKASQPAGLERVLAELNIPSRYLHNAGNDAVYTMQAMIGLAFKLRQKSLERSHGRLVNRATGSAEPKDDEGWATGGDESDGGKPGDKGSPMSYTGHIYLRGKAFQPGEDVVRRPAPSPPRNNVFSWSDYEDELSDAEHLRW